VKLLLATSNAHKVAELRRALPGWEIEAFVAPGQPPEDGVTFEANARIKARHARAHAPADAWVAGEDSGIEAAALGGKPGVESARWAEDGVAALLSALDGDDDRRARYVCAIVAISPEGDEIVATGTLEGEVTTSPRGSGGFGYDPIVVPEGESRTVAELGDAWKAESSHRARAGRSLAAALRGYGASGSNA
jgi:XTP/dITP diphosphohydrolase